MSLYLVTCTGGSCFFRELRGISFLSHGTWTLFRGRWNTATEYHSFDRIEFFLDYFSLYFQGGTQNAWILIFSLYGSNNVRTFVAYWYGQFHYQPNVTISALFDNNSGHSILRMVSEKLGARAYFYLFRSWIFACGRSFRKRKNEIFDTFKPRGEESRDDSDL